MSIGAPQTIQDVADDVWYAPWSLRVFAPGRDGNVSASQKWTAQEMIINVLRAVIQTEKDFNGLDVPFYGIQDDTYLKQLPIENLLLDDSSDQALQRALGYLPEMSLYIDEQGRIQFYSRASGKEKEMSDAAGPEKVGGGIIKWISNRYRRPRKIHVLFTREVELRFDFDEIDAIEGAESEISLDPTQMLQRRLQNVLPMPDFESPVNKITQGTWTEFNSALKEWNSDDKGWPTLANGTLANLEYIRRAMIPFIDLWACLNISGLVDSNSDWMGRVNAITANFRRTFKIVPNWWDRILSIHNYRVSLINKETGSRAPSLVYGNFCRLNNQRSMYRDAYAQVGEKRGKIFYAINAAAYPLAQAGSQSFEPCELYPLANLPGTDREKMFAGDAKLVIADAEQGVLRVEYVPDIYHAYDVILPGNMESSGSPYTIEKDLPVNAGPSLDIKDRAQGITFDSVAEFNESTNNFDRVPQLKAEYKMAVVLTAIPATWHPSSGGNQNVDHQLEKITIDPSAEDGDRLLEMVHPHVAESIRDAVGPDLYVRVGSGVEVARIAWDDKKFEEIEKIFGVNKSGNENPPDLGDLVINRGSNAEGASLNQIALAIAARVYSGYVDHVQGAMRGTMVPGIHPSGWLDEVTYTVGSTGEGSVSIDMPESVDQFDMMSYLDDSTRATIMKLAQP